MAAERQEANPFLSPAPALTREEGEKIFNNLIKRAHEVGTSFTDGVLPGRRIILLMNWKKDVLYQRVEFSELPEDDFAEAERTLFRFDEERQIHVYECRQRLDLFKERLEKKEKQLSHSIQKIPEYCEDVANKAPNTETHARMLELSACADVISAGRKILFYAGAGLSALYLRSAQESAQKFGYPPYGRFNEFVGNYVLKRPMALVDGCYYQLMLNSPSKEDIDDIRRETTTIFQKQGDSWLLHFLNTQNEYTIQEIEDVEQIHDLEAILDACGMLDSAQIEIKDRIMVEKLVKISAYYGRSSLVDIGMVLNYAKVLETNANPSPAHQALADLAQLLGAPLVTTNSDPYFEKSGIMPYRLPSGLRDPSWNTETIKQIDMVVFVGCAQVDDFIGLYHEHNPEGRVVALNIRAEKYLREGDFLLPGDVQETLPKLVQLIAAKNKADTVRHQDQDITAADLLATRGQFSRVSEAATVAVDTDPSDGDQPAYSLNS